MTEDHSQIHKLYCQLTNREMPLTMSLHFAWNAWKAKGWGQEELRLTVAYIKNMINKGRRYPESLRFNNLIMDTDRFLFDLTDARAADRVPKVDEGKASVLRGTFRPTESSAKPVEKIGEILSRTEIAAKLREIRLSL